jgi:hypothetical protein
MEQKPNYEENKQALEATGHVIKLIQLEYWQNSQINFLVLYTFF